MSCCNTCCRVLKDGSTDCGNHGKKGGFCSNCDKFGVVTILTSSELSLCPNCEEDPEYPQVVKCRLEPVIDSTVQFCPKPCQSYPDPPVIKYDAFPAQQRPTPKMCLCYIKNDFGCHYPDDEVKPCCKPRNLEMLDVGFFIDVQIVEL